MKNFILLFFLVAVAGLMKTQRKIIHDENFDYEFFVLVKHNENPQREKEYFWFKGGEIHSSQGGIGGNLLHGQFAKYYKTSQLAQRGEFHEGLKKGEWKKWFESGAIKEVMNYRSGMPHGRYYHYDINGNITSKGRFRGGNKVGKWIENKSDTLLYRNGKLKIKDTINGPGFFKKLFQKKVEKEETIISQDTVKKPFLKRIFGIFKEKEKNKLKTE